MMRKPSGIRPTCERWNIPGSNLRLARSPVAPKRTITWSVFTGWAALALIALWDVTLTLRSLQRATPGPIVGAHRKRDQGGHRVRPGGARADRGALLPRPLLRGAGRG